MTIHTRDDKIYYVACPLRYNAVIRWIKGNINPNDVNLTTTLNCLNFKENNVGFSNKNLNLNKNKKKYEFRSAKSFKENNVKEKCLVLEGTPCSIIFQNIVSYMSGVEHMWGEGKKRKRKTYSKIK